MSRLIFLAGFNIIKLLDLNSNDHMDHNLNTLNVEFNCVITFCLLESKCNISSRPSQFAKTITIFSDRLRFD